MNINLLHLKKYSFTFEKKPMYYESAIYKVSKYITFILKRFD